jgi:tetratricopeptide (TPR) repeat protein
MLGQPDEAIRHYRRATELNPAEAHPFVLIGTLLNGQEKYAEAADSFRRSIAIRALNPEAHAGLGFALARLGRREEAMRALQTALQQQPDYPLAKAWLEALAATPTAK